MAEIESFSPVGGEPLSPAQQRLLREVGELFRSTPRQIDMAARLGGGRFALLLPYTDEHGAFLLAERLRSRVEALESPGHERVRLSFGAARL